MNGKYSCSKKVVIDWDGIPAAIVAVSDGEPLVMLVSEETLRLFDVTKRQMGLTHVELANKLRELINGRGGEFCENSVFAWLKHHVFPFGGGRVV